MGEYLALTSICCSFCSAESCEARGFFSICCAMYSRQLKWLFKARAPRKLKTTINAVGRIQVGFLAISSKVAFGEKNTPIRRPMGEMDAWGSATGIGEVAIEDSLTTKGSDVCCCQYYANAAGKISQGTGSGNLWDGGEEFAGIDVGGLAEDEVGGSIFDELAGAHDGNVGGELRDYGKTVGDEEIGEVKFLLEFLKEEENLGADGDIEGGDGFISNDERGAENQGASDADALALAAGKLVRVAVCSIAGQANATQELLGAAEAIVARELRFVNRQWLGGNFANAHAGIQGSERILKDHLHLATLSAERFARELQ